MTPTRLQNRWPEPRPPLTLTCPPHPLGSATPWLGRAHDSLPAEVHWLLTVDQIPAGHQGAFELTLDIRWRRFGCTRLFELRLHTHPKTSQAPSQQFTYTFHPTDRPSLRQLGLLHRQAYWHLLLISERQVVRAVELRNTLDLNQLIRSAWHPAS